MKHAANPDFSDLSEDTPAQASASYFPEAETISPSPVSAIRDLTGLDGETCPLVRPGLVLKDYGPVSVVVDSVTSEKLKLSRDSARLLLLCDGKRTIPEICAEYGRTASHRAASGACDPREILGAFFERGVLLPGRSQRAAGRSD
jgi:hypothetical protein